MEFGSEKVFMYEEPEFEVISEEEYYHGMSLSESNSCSDEDVDQGSSPQNAPAGQHRRRKKAKKYGKWRYMDSALELRSPVTRDNGEKEKRTGKQHRRADTNIISVDFKKLIAPSNMHTGDPVCCSSCDVILSSLSKILKVEEKKVWRCEFCGTNNELDIQEEEVPKENDVTFMLEPAPSTKASSLVGTDASLVVFCVDVSGSMTTPTKVPGKVNLRGLGSSYTENTNHATYVTRLQVVQAAVDHQLEEMMKQHPNRRIALITFGDKVCVIGDGSKKPMFISGNKLTDAKKLKKIGSKVAMPKAISGTRKTLGDRLFQLKDYGFTALGPALQIATAMAGQHPGSKVIICTDGEANVGLGRLDARGKELEKETEFYQKVGEESADKGVAVSVISIKGAECGLVHLGKIADLTGGQVNIVDPLKLTKEFSTILADRIIATNVIATCNLHKHLFFYYEETETSKVVRDVGNVTSSTEITFEYGVRCKPQQKKSGEETISEEPECKESSINDQQKGQGGSEQQAAGEREQVEEVKEYHTEEKLMEVPFQLAIKYTDTEGAVALRVLTQMKSITYDRKEAEKKMNLKVVGVHTAQTASALALGGQYTQSRAVALMNQRLASRYTNETDEGREHRKSYKKMFGKIKKVDHYLNRQQQEEIRTRGRTHSESEEEEGEEIPTASAKAPSRFLSKKSKSKKSKQRSNKCSDRGANVMFQMKQGSSFLNDSDSDEDSGDNVMFQRKQRRSSLRSDSDEDSVANEIFQKKQRSSSLRSDSDEDSYSSCDGGLDKYVTYL